MDGGGASMMMIHTTCEQLTGLLQREVRYRPATTTTSSGATAVALERQGSMWTVNSNFFVKIRTDLCNWSFQGMLWLQCSPVRVGK
jgi:hypothetical protein